MTENELAEINAKRKSVGKPPINAEIAAMIEAHADRLPTYQQLMEHPGIPEAVSEKEDAE